MVQSDWAMAVCCEMVEKDIFSLQRKGKSTKCPWYKGLALLVPCRSDFLQQFEFLLPGFICE